MLGHMDDGHAPGYQCGVWHCLSPHNVTPTSRNRQNRRCRTEMVRVLLWQAFCTCMRGLKVFTRGNSRLRSAKKFHLWPLGILIVHNTIRFANSNACAMVSFLCGWRAIMENCKSTISVWLVMHHSNYRTQYQIGCWVDVPWYTPAK